MRATRTHESIQWDSLLIWKDPDAGQDWRWEEERTTEGEMVGWHHRLNGHEFEQTPGVGDGQGGLACFSPWGRKELDMTEWLTHQIIFKILLFSHEVNISGAIHSFTEIPVSILCHFPSDLRSSFNIAYIAVLLLMDSFSFVCLKRFLFHIRSWKIFLLDIEL